MGFLCRIDDWYMYTSSGYMQTHVNDRTSNYGHFVLSF